MFPQSLRSESLSSIRLSSSVVFDRFCCRLKTNQQEPRDRPVSSPSVQPFRVRLCSPQRLAMLVGGSVLRSRRVVNNVHKARGAGRRIFIPSVVLSVDVVVVLVKHTERQSCRKILMFPHQNQDRNPAHLQLWVSVTLVTRGCGFRWTLLVFGSGAD